MKVPLFTFATFVTAPPTAKLACVSDLKHAGSYDPRIDFWKQLRDFIPRNHRRGGSKADLDRFADEAAERKQASFTARVDAYKQWWGPRNIRWTSGAATTWASNGVDVSVNPELFLSVDGVRHVVKLYFKTSERLTTDRAQIVLRFLELAYRGGASPDGRPVVAVLDLAQGEFHTPTTSLAPLDALLAGETASFASIWKAV